MAGTEAAISDREVIPRSQGMGGSRPRTRCRRPWPTEDVRLFAADVRGALDGYLRYGQEQGFTRQSLLLAALDGYPERPRMIEWIRENGGDMWGKYLDKIAPDSSPRLTWTTTEDDLLPNTRPD
jgi:hypothetical protein